MADTRLSHKDICRVAVLEYPQNIRNYEHAQAGRAAVFSAFNGPRGRLKTPVRLSGLVRKLSVNRRVWLRCATRPGVFVILEILRSGTVSTPVISIIDGFSFPVLFTFLANTGIREAN